MGISVVAEPGPELTGEQEQRYAHQLRIPQFGPVAQRRLANVTVGVVGAGGLGSAASLYLAAAGVGGLTIIDDDVVELSNLQRQILYTTAQLGQPKTACSQQRLQELNPQCSVEVCDIRLTAQNAAQLLDGHRIVIDASDNDVTRQVVSDTCAATNSAHVWGAVWQTWGRVATFWRKPPNGKPGTVLSDIFVPQPNAETVVSSQQKVSSPDAELGNVAGPGGEEPAGVIAPLCGVIGSMMAMEAIKLATGVGEPLLDTMVQVNALTWQFTTIALAPPRIGGECDTQREN